MSGSLVTAYIGLGSNLGDREAHLNRAVEMLENTSGVRVIKVSAYFNTAPVGYTEQPDFLNAVAEIETSLTAYELLGICCGIEKTLKRERIVHWGPRTIDLDILLFGNLVLNDASLTIPHPRMLEREFVLKPLNEIAPERIHPVCSKSIRELYHEFLLTVQSGPVSLKQMHLIVAADQNWAIGKKNELLIKIPEDQAFFREKTIGKVVVMGRKTLDSLPGGMPLKSRTNIVLTKNKNFQVENAIAVHSLKELMEELKNYGGRNMYVIGGGSIYQLLLPYCDTAYVTKIFHSYDADTYFTNLDQLNEWKMVSRSAEKTQSGLNYVFMKYKKQGGNRL
ncbi:2-amino-4-hydroxy-6-hydroxymethyldihydropteridine diphosphokinase [Caproicibacter fermentans]